ncbi:hypothetical protein ACIQCR_08155 [Streptomyces sp. NPDC093249]|uniref:hypothetical protein n=1 Tax=unclassified Streptomyces TaxID=2593676 RepID=UPI00344B6A8E
MGTSDMKDGRNAVLLGGPADGVEVTVTGRPPVLQVTYPCAAEGAGAGVRIEALHVYRLDGDTDDGRLRYGYDPASP